MTEHQDHEPLTDTALCADVDEYCIWVSGCIMGREVRDILYPTIALGGEVGEIQNLVKKALRNGDISGVGMLRDDEARKMLVDELGDVLHYCMRVCLALEVAPSVVIGQNITKINKRFADGTFKKG